jgi:hypothetical protein
VESPVGDFVDGWRVRVARVVSDTESEIAKGEALAVANEAQDHAELAIRRWQIDLEASRELRPVASFGIAAAKGLDLDTLPLELVASLAKRLSACATTSHRVLGEGALVKEDAGIPPPDGQGLPLAVCGLERPVLGL